MPESELRLVEVRVSRIDADIVFQQLTTVLHRPYRCDGSPENKIDDEKRSYRSRLAGLVDHFLRHVQSTDLVHVLLEPTCIPTLSW